MFRIQIQGSSTLDPDSEFSYLNGVFSDDKFPGWAGLPPAAC